MLLNQETPPAKVKDNKTAITIEGLNKYGTNGTNAPNALNNPA